MMIISTRYIRHQDLDIEVGIDVDLELDVEVCIDIDLELDVEVGPPV